MDSTIVTPTPLTPGIGFSANNGPAWSACSPAEGALFSTAATGRVGHALHADSNFVAKVSSDSVNFTETRLDFGRDAQEIRNLVYGTYQQFGALQKGQEEIKLVVMKTLADQEAARLRDQLAQESQKNLIASIVAAIKA